MPDTLPCNNASCNVELESNNVLPIPDTLPLPNASCKVIIGDNAVLAIPTHSSPL